MRLVIETAGINCSVALFDGDALVDHAHEAVGRGHAERLVPMIAALRDGGRARDLLVDCGPGSFTGVRVGVAAARGLALGWGGTARGFSSLALLAARHFGTSDALTATIAIPGGHGELFVQRFARAPFAALGPLASLRPEAVAADDLHQPGTEALDARDTQLLDAAAQALPPVPLYGRGADARPMA